MMERLQDGFWIGVDIAKATVDVCVAGLHFQTSEWAKLEVRHLANDAKGIPELAHWLAPALKAGECLGVCIESTGAYSHWFVRAIAGLELRGVLVSGIPYDPNYKKRLNPS
ncbi:MAG: hypothetical protein SGI88_13130 [Candidatus Hydrogenedentes bacterium]|nr:hypothetical protein [Candidatus Hydrogenedentota bacterium]